MKHLFTLCFLLLSLITTGKTIQGNIDAAIYLMNNGRHDKAEILLESMHSEDPSFNAVKGINYLHLGRVLAAEKYLFKAALSFMNADTVSVELIPTLKALTRIYESKSDEFNHQASALDGILDKKAFFYNGYVNLGLVTNDICEIEEHYIFVKDKLMLLYSKEDYNPLKFALEYEMDRLESTFHFQNIHPPERLFAGIEVGSKGVKLSVIKLKSDLKGEYAYEIVKDSSINTDVINFTEDAITRTIDAVSQFYTVARQMRIDDNNIFMAISNGVKSRAESESKLYVLGSVQDQIRQKIGQSSKEIYVLTEEDEPRLTHLGVITKANRDVASIVDIGSGNCKGGFFTYNSSDFNSFSFEWGTKAIALHMEKLYPNTTIEEYANHVQKFVDSIMTVKVKYMLDTRASMYNKEQIVLSGGINWAIATVIMPGNLEYAFASINLKDVRIFKAKAIYDYNEMRKIENYLWQVKPSEKEAVRNELGKVFDTFSQRDMIAGVTLLEAMMSKFIQSSTVPKKFYMARYGYIGWITGQIIRSLGSEK
ncbi:MAG: hypothetical protein KA536_11475 [Saprospiraceae bacterium]|nr:hypothetical protein [Saprospiraceae bacterium]